MKIIHVPDYETLSRKTAQLIAAQVLCKPDSLLGLATGSSPVGAYRYLAQWHISGDLDFSRACSVNLDEYCGLGADHVQSYHFFMRQNLFDAVNFRASWLPDGCAESLPDECRRYEAIIAERLTCNCWGLGITGTSALMSRQNSLSRRPTWRSFHRGPFRQTPAFLTVWIRCLSRRSPWASPRFYRQKKFSCWPGWEKGKFSGKR